MERLFEPATWPPWAVMWATGVVVYLAVKGATAACVRGWTGPTLAFYLTQTPTLDPAPFVRGRGETAADERWWTGLVGVACGAAVWALGVPSARLVSDWFGGLAVMAGVLCGLHFGLFRLMTAALNRLGYAAGPIMRRPWRSHSLAEFWGRRWNVAFRDAATRLFVRPLRRSRPAPQLAAAVFLASGLIHDVVMSTPAGGWGGPTAYFLIQAAGLTAQRTRASRRRGLDAGRAGALTTAAVVLGPLPLLFHRPFCAEVMLPFFDWCVGRAG